jgi:hypothetical protein
VSMLINCNNLLRLLLGLPHAHPSTYSKTGHKHVQHSLKTHTLRKTRP